VHDVREDAYGYGGLTQGRRYIARQLAAPASAAA
jgi:4-oxalocrotonate tautomerase